MSPILPVLFSDVNILFYSNHISITEDRNVSKQEICPYDTDAPTFCHKK